MCGFSLFRARQPPVPVSCALLLWTVPIGYKMPKTPMTQKLFKKSRFDSIGLLDSAIQCRIFSIIALLWETQ